MGVDRDYGRETLERAYVRRKQVGNDRAVSTLLRLFPVEKLRAVRNELDIATFM